MLTCLTNFIHSEDGATMVEYGLMVAFIALVCVGAVTTIGPKVNGMFTGVLPGLR